MSTRSAILEKTDSGYRGIYCHFDGYPSGVGKILLEQYADPKKVFALINLGNLSSLGKKIAPAKSTIHTFDSPQENVTVAYDRDLGEDEQEPIVGTTIEEVESQIGHDGYVYVFENNKWTCNGDPLEEAVERDS